MKVEDYKNITDLWKSIDGVGLRNLDDSKEGISKFLKRNPTTCFVSELDNLIVGTIMCGHDGRRGYIYHLAVDSHYRKQGIAKELVDKSIDALKLEGINKVALVVFEDNKIGNEFWENQGFIKRLDLIYRNKSINEDNF